MNGNLGRAGGDSQQENVKGLATHRVCLPAGIGRGDCVQGFGLDKLVAGVGTPANCSPSKRESRPYRILTSGGFGCKRCSTSHKSSPSPPSTCSRPVNPLAHRLHSPPLPQLEVGRLIDRLPSFWNSLQSVKIGMSIPTLTQTFLHRCFAARSASGVAPRPGRVRRCRRKLGGCVACTPYGGREEGLVTLGNIIRRLTGLCRPLSRFGWQCHREQQSTMPS